MEKISLVDEIYPAANEKICDRIYDRIRTLIIIIIIVVVIIVVIAPLAVDHTIHLIQRFKE